MAGEQTIFDPDLAIFEEAADHVVVFKVKVVPHEHKIDDQEPEKHIELEKVATFLRKQDAINYCNIYRGRKL